MIFTFPFKLLGEFDNSLSGKPNKVLNSRRIYKKGFRKLSVMISETICEALHLLDWRHS